MNDLFVTLSETIIRENMKKIGIIIITLLSLNTFLVAQESKKDSTKVDTMTFRLKNSIITIRNRVPEEIVIKKSDSLKNGKKQRLDHFSGIDLGVNGFFSEDGEFDLENDAEFMNLNYAKSWSIAFNFFEVYIPIAKEKFGVSTGLGIEFNNYFFDKEITLASTGDTTIGIVDPTKNIDKNRLKATVLNWPVFLETNIGKDAKHSFHLAVGGMVSYRLGSKTKQEFEQNGEDFKVKNRTDFNMNPFRVNAVARIGYGSFTLFASYGLTPLFDDNKAPEIYPFTVGVSILTM